MKALTFFAFGLHIVALLSGCARPQYVAEEHAALQAPVTLGEGNTGKPPLPADSPAPSEPVTAKPARDFDPSAQPDPPPTETSAYYNLTLRFCDSAVHLMDSKKVELERPTTLPSKMGRFAVELWIGRELLERARFDFPLLGAETQDESLAAAPQFGPKADVAWTVAVAARERTTRAWVVDRLTEQRWDLDWPPGDVDVPRSVTKNGDVPCPSSANTAP